MSAEVGGGEREALAALLDSIHRPAVTEGGCIFGSYGYEHEADLMLAAGWSRTPAPVEEEWRVIHPHPDHPVRAQDGREWTELASEEQARNYERSGYKIERRTIGPWTSPSATPAPVVGGGVDLAAAIGALADELSADRRDGRGSQRSLYEDGYGEGHHDARVEIGKRLRAVLGGGDL